MDLKLFSRVIWRFRIIIAAGFVLALGLAVLATAQLTFQNGISLKYRTPTFYKADAILLVTQKGFPWGSAVQQYLDNGNAKTGKPPTAFGDQARLTYLAQVYAEYADSDTVRRILARKGMPNGTVDAQPMITNPNVGAPTLPLIDISATASSADGTRALAQAATNALVAYIRAQQQASVTPPNDWVIIQELRHPQTVTVVQKPKKTPSILVFLAVMIGVIALAFVLDNLRKPPPVARQDIGLPDHVAPVVADELPAVASELRQAPRH
jgi:hypothetical protein